METNTLKYFENIRIAELDPYDYGIFCLDLVGEVKKSIGTSRSEYIQKYIEGERVRLSSFKSSQNISECISSANELMQEVESVSKASRINLLEFHSMLHTSHDTVPENNEATQEFNNASDQLYQHIREVEARNMESAVRGLQNIHFDDEKGGVARLVSSIDIGVKSVEDAAILLNSKVAESRKEFISIRHSEDLLESATKLSYEKLRECYSNLLRACNRRGRENDQQWSALEAQSRETMKLKMNAILQSTRGSEESFRNNLEEKRRVSLRHFQSFSDNYLDIVNQRLSKENDRRIKAHRVRYDALDWKMKNQYEMDTWLSKTTKHIEDTYSSNVTNLSTKIGILKSQITILEIHMKKLQQLCVLNGAPTGNGNTNGDVSSSSHVTSNNIYPATTRSDTKDSNHSQMSMKFGTRIKDLAYAACISDEETAVLLTQMLHHIPPTHINASKVAFFVGQYRDIVKSTKE